MTGPTEDSTEQETKRSTTCSICKKAFSQKSSLVQHMLIHTGKTPYKCDACGKTFVQKSACEVHKRRVHNTEKSFKCSECDYAGKILCDLQNHRMRMHSTDRSYKCDVCEEGFSTAARRNNHIAQVHERGPHFPCTECCYKTQTKNLLQMHIKARHTSTEGYKCGICGTVLKTQYSRQVHMRSHTGSKPYQCDECGKEFVSSSRVAAHRKTHAERECVCTMCGKKFINKHKLKIHEDGVHGSSVLFPCPWCKYQTAVKHNLKKHCKNVHDLDYPPRTSSRSIPITQREIASKNGSQTIVLPPPVYPHALDIGLKGIKEKTNTLLVKQLPIYISNVRHPRRKNVYSVEIYKHKKLTENNPTNNVKRPFPSKEEESEQTRRIITEDELVFSSANRRNTNYKEGQELSVQKLNNGLMNPPANASNLSCCDKSASAPTLQTLLSQPKDNVVRNKTIKGTHHTVWVVENRRDRSVSVNNNTSLIRSSETNYVSKISGGISTSGGHSYSDLNSSEDSDELAIVDNFEETNVALCNVETIAVQPVLLESVQVLPKEDHSYFVIDNNEDIDGVNIQEVVIDNSGHSLQFSMHESH